MPKFNDELVQVFKQWSEMEDKVTPVYLKMEELIDQHLGSKKNNPIAHGRTIVELTSLTLQQSASESTEESMISQENIPVGNELKEKKVKVKESKPSEEAPSKMPSPVREKNAND